MVQGEWFRKSTKEADRKKALLKEKEFRQRFISERTGLRTDITLGHAIDEFAVVKEGTPNHENVTQDGKVLKAILGPGLPLQDITTAHVTRLVTKLKKKGYANSTIKHRLQTYVVRSNMRSLTDTLFPRLNIRSSESLEGVRVSLLPTRFNQLRTN